MASEQFIGVLMTSRFLIFVALQSPSRIERERGEDMRSRGGAWPDDTLCPRGAAQRPITYEMDCPAPQLSFKMRC